MGEAPDTIRTTESDVRTKHLLSVEIDTLGDSTTRVCTVVEDSFPRRGEIFVLESTNRSIAEVRFDGIRYKPRMGDFGLVQFGFFSFLIIFIVFLSRGQVYIIRSLELLRSVIIKNNSRGTDRTMRLQSEEDTSVLLRIQTICLYSFTIIYYYYYHSQTVIDPIPLLSFTGLVMGSAFLLGSIMIGTDYILGFLFAEPEEMQAYLNIKRTTTELSSFLLWIAVLSLVYSDHFKPVFFGIIIALFALTKLIEWIASIVIFSRGAHSILDFILYLCTAEIMPYLLFYRLIEYFYSKSVA